ncbi:MAG: M48 family metallopeptidase [Actinomycetota bacterium]|nr:M48 family metallopeptidase [Actinomycetota bacterium]
MIVSIGLQLGVYLVAGTVLAALVAANYGIYLAGRIYPALIIVTVFVVLGVLRALWSMRVPFVEPFGLEVTATEPELIRVIHEVASAVGSDPPDAVYLVPDVNAFVTEDARFGGLVSRRRVLGIGVPLIHSLNIGELRAILGHEFGHFAGGDTKLGSVVYRGQRSATVLAQSAGGGLIADIFVWYANFVVRTSSAVSRRQEVAADLFAVNAFGSAPMRSALGKIDDAAVAFDQFASGYLTPLFQQRCRPINLFTGYEAVYRDPTRQAQREDETARRRRRAPNPYDTHPTASTRLETIEHWPAVIGTVASDDRPANELLSPQAASADRLSELIASRIDPRLTPIEWTASAEVLGRTNDWLVDLGFAGPLGWAEQRALLDEWATKRYWDIPRRRVLDRAPQNYFPNRMEAIDHWLRATFERQLAQLPGNRWTLRWDGPALLSSETGETLDCARRRRVSIR